MDEQLLREFLAEADELIEALYEDVRLWRARGGGGGREGRESVARAFRCVHTIKGSAAAAGLEEVGRLAHELEGLLEGVRAGRVAAETDVLDAFEAAAEGLSEGLSAAARGGAWGVPAPLVERLRRLSARAAAAPRARGEVFGALPREVAESLGEAERARLAEAVAEGASVFVVSADFDLSSFDERFRQLSEVLSEGGEVVSTLPGVSEVEAGGVNFRVVYATREGREQTRARVAHFGATLLADASDAGFNDAGAAPASSDEGPGDEAGEGARGGGRSLSALTMLVRVPLEELDELTSAAHQIFNDSLTAIERAAGGLAEGEARAEAEAESKRLRRRFFELEERLIGLRMVPLHQTLERAARVGASAARAAGREVEFLTRGGHVRLDKSLAEAVSDPLLHLLRNAVDHGVETPDERLAAGKTARGLVTLEAEAEGGLVVVRVSDDGRGVEPDRVARAAAERGIIARGQSVTERQALRLIFRPGFSTSRGVSAVSGRGVGLDVVERTVESLGGELRVRSRAGFGTTFEMRLPTTLALLPALFVTAGGESYCVAASHVQEAVRVAASDITGEEGSRRVRWRGAELPLVTLASLVGGRADGGVFEGDGAHVLVSRDVRRGAVTHDEAEEAGRVAVAVDSLAGRGEVLVRSLGRHASRWRGVSGATELRDGTVALLLDLPRLLESH